LGRSQHGVVYGKRLRSTRKRETLQFESGEIVACVCVLSKSDIVRQQQRLTGSDAVDQKLGVEKLEDRLGFRILIHELKTRLRLCEFDKHSDARD